MFVRIIAAFLIVLCSTGYSRPPQLTPKDTKIKIEEILKAHVSAQNLSPQLIKRAFNNYLDEVDPGKTYFIENEIDRWTNPSEEALNQAIREIRSENFNSFEEIHEALLIAIERRALIEKKIESLDLVPNVKATEFKDMPWAKSEEELTERILKIKSLQLSTAEKLNQESKEQFKQRLSKRRLSREQELTSGSKEEKVQLILSTTLKAISSSLDSQTAYFTPSEANQFIIQVQQRLFGIGAQLKDDLDGLSVMRLLEGGPALLGNKLKVSDKIIAVDHEPIVGMDITEAVELIRGQQGTTVTLTILRKGSEPTHLEEKLDIDIVRAEVVLKESRLETSVEPFGDGVIAVLHLFSFYQDNKSSSATDLANEIKKLKTNSNLKGIVLDLRNNAGGLLDQAVAVTGLFIDKGVVVSVKDNSGQVKRLRNLDNRKVWDGPLIVLTNRLSASASEIVAQTLQEYGRTFVVGDDHTFGKGTFQTFTLESAHFGKVNPKGEYKVTRGRYYTVSGKSPQLTGVVADIQIPGVFSKTDIGEKFSKFPLDSDQIDASYQDDMTDVPYIHKAQLTHLYKNGQQKKAMIYAPYLSAIKANSEQRIQQNKAYQNFLKELDNQDNMADAIDEFIENDMQREEALNVMKDLLYLTDKALQPQAA